GTASRSWWLAQPPLRPQPVVVLRRTVTRTRTRAPDPLAGHPPSVGISPAQPGCPARLGPSRRSSALSPAPARNWARLGRRPKANHRFRWPCPTLMSARDNALRSSVGQGGIDAWRVHRPSSLPHARSGHTLAFAMHWRVPREPRQTLARVV